MSMNTFPTIEPPKSPIDGTIEDHTIKGESDGVTILTRPRFTKDVYVFKPQWDAMNSTDFASLKSFYQQMRGNALEFIWTHPNEGAEANNTYRVRFDGNMDWKLSNLGYYEVSITLKGYEVTT